jgi:hypothetical protein
MNLGRTTGVDPLLGGPPLPPAGQAANAATPPPAVPLTLLPPQPAPNPATSNAALAAAGSRSLDNGGDLRIANPRPSTGNDGWVGQAPALGGDGSGAVLRRPELAAEPASRRDPAPVSSPTATANSRITTYEQAQAQLSARGIIWQRLETGSTNGEWKFTCSIPNRQNPRLHRTYEARGTDPVSAVRAALEQIDKDQ